MAFLGLGTHLLCLSLVLIGAYDNLSTGRISNIYELDEEDSRKSTSFVVTDGNTTSCLSSSFLSWIGIKSFDRKIAGLNVDLSMLQSIYQVDIFQGIYFINNWLVYISTTDRVENGTLCTRTAPLSDRQRFNCTGHGRFVILVSENRDTKIRYSVCEINVTGCVAGKFGENCTNSCSENCVGKICNIVDGKCTMCSSGWKGDHCEQKCTDGYFGSDCTKRCTGRCLDGAACNAVTGTCDGGCAPGWRNADCSEECTEGYFGDNCTKRCTGSCLDGAACNAVTGTCDGGCAPGWRNSDCSKECADGYFGSNCTKRCTGRCLDGAACNAVTGTCDGGCAPGWRNADCSDVCSNGFFGEQCAQQCNLSCDPFTGFYSGTITQKMSGQSEQSSEGSNALVSGLVVVLVVSVLVNFGLLVMYCKRYNLKRKEACSKEAPLYGNAEMEGSANVQSARGGNTEEATVYYESLNDSTRDQDTQNYSTLEN